MTAEAYKDDRPGKPAPKRRADFPSGALSYSTYSPIMTEDDIKRQEEQRKLRQQFIKGVDSTLQRRPVTRSGEPALYTAASMPGGLDLKSRSSENDGSDGTGSTGRRVYGLRDRRNSSGGGIAEVSDADDFDEDSGEQGGNGGTTAGSKGPTRAISITGEILTKGSQAASSRSARSAGRLNTAVSGTYRTAGIDAASSGRVTAERSVSQSITRIAPITRNTRTSAGF